MRKQVWLGISLINFIGYSVKIQHCSNGSCTTTKSEVLSSHFTKQTHSHTKVIVVLPGLKFGVNAELVKVAFDGSLNISIKNQFKGKQLELIYFDHANNEEGTLAVRIVEYKLDWNMILV